MKFRELFAHDGLSLDRLRTLVLIDDSGSLVAAASHDETRAGQFSRQLGELEAFFAVPLKERGNHKTVRLNATGRELARIAREHLQALDEFHRTCTQRPPAFTLGAGDSLHRWVVLPRLAALRALARDAIWHLHTLQNTQMCQRLVDGTLDFALLRSDLVGRNAANGKTDTPSRGSDGGKTGAPKIAGVPLGTLTYSVFVPHAICAPGKEVTLQKIIATQPIATQGDDTLFQRRLEAEMASRGWKMKVGLYGESFPQVAQAVASGAMAGILPDVATAMFDVEKVWRAPLHDFAGLHRAISLAWNPSRHGKRPALEKIREAVAGILRFGT